MVRNRTMLVAGLALVASIAGACGGSNGPAPKGAGGTSVAISGFLFKPEKLTVHAGTTVTWTNGDDIDHTVTAGTPGAPTGSFDSGNEARGATFSHAFMEPGTFPYFCKNHDGMRGEVDVT